MEVCIGDKAASWMGKQSMAGGWLACLAMLALSLCMATYAQAQTVYSVTHLEVATDFQEDTQQALRDHGQALQAAGAEQVVLLQQEGRDNHFAILESWNSRDAFAEGEAARLELNASLRPMLISARDQRLHENLLPSPAFSGGEGLYVLTHVDMVPTARDNGSLMVETLVQASREQAGNLRFDAWVQEDRSNHLTLVEHWEDRESFEAHGRSAAKLAFRWQLTPISGSLYDERLFRPLP